MLDDRFTNVIHPCYFLNRDRIHIKPFRRLKHRNRFLAIPAISAPASERIRFLLVLLEPEIIKPKMDQILRSPALFGLLVLSLVVYFGNQRYKPKYDPKEPPVLPQKLPYIGHIIGLIFSGLSYYKKLR